MRLGERITMMQALFQYYDFLGVLGQNLRVQNLTLRDLSGSFEFVTVMKLTQNLKRVPIATHRDLRHARFYA